MLLIILSRLIFAWIYFPRMLFLPYVADGDTFIFADDDILIISWGSVVAVNKITFMSFIIKGGEEQFLFPKLPKI